MESVIEPWSRRGGLRVSGSRVGGLGSGAYADFLRFPRPVLSAAVGRIGARRCLGGLPSSSHTMDRSMSQLLCGKP